MKAITAQNFHYFAPLLFLLLDDELLPLGRKTRFGGHENFEDCPAIFLCQRREIGTLLATAADFKQPAVDIVFGRPRNTVEGFRVDQITAGVPEDSGLEIEVAKGPTFGIAWTPGGELLGIAGAIVDGTFELRFFGEQEIADQVFDGGFVLHGLNIGMKRPKVYRVKVVGMGPADGAKALRQQARQPNTAPRECIILRGIMICCASTRASEPAPQRSLLV